MKARLLDSKELLRKTECNQTRKKTRGHVFCIDHGYCFAFAQYVTGPRKRALNAVNHRSQRLKVKFSNHPRFLHQLEAEAFLHLPANPL